MKAKKMAALLMTATMAVTAASTAMVANAEGIEPHADQTYYMVTFVSGYSFWQECWRGFEDAAKLLGVEAKYGGSTEYDMNACITALDQIIALNPTGMAVTCMDSEAYKPSIDNAVASGIPVVTFDADCPSSARTTFIGTSNYAAGATGAEYIGEQLGGEGRVVVLMKDGQSNMHDRLMGFQDTLAEKYPGVELVQVVDSGSNSTDGAANMASFLAKDSDIDYVFAPAQASVLATETALAEAGLTGEIKVVGFDTDTTTLDSIKAGTVEASISQSPYAEGFWSMMYLYFLGNQELVDSADDWYAKGYPTLPATCDSGSTVITAENADMFYIEGAVTAE